MGLKKVENIFENELNILEKENRLKGKEDIIIKVLKPNDKRGRELVPRRYL